MSKGIILYQSKYGATKKYAGWLVERIGYDCVETKNAKVADLKNYDVIILGGGVYASGIAGLQFIKKNIGQLADKKLAVFAVGASPYDKKAIMQIREMHFRNELRNIPLFYCRGAWDEEKMKFADRTLCKMLQKAVAKQNPDEYEPWQKALMYAVGQKCDWTDKSYLEPLLKYIEELCYGGGLYEKVCVRFFNLGYDYTHSDIEWGISRICACISWGISTSAKWYYIKYLNLSICV